MTVAITLEHVSKAYRVYHERNQDLKRRILRHRRHVFEQFWALNDVSLTVDVGEILGVVGSNGSGKSTLLRLLAGTLQPDGGNVSVVGTVSGLLELGAGFHPELTGRENIFLSGALLGIPRSVLKTRFEDIVEFSGIGNFIDNPVKTYSSGMYARLGFAVATNVNPDVLLVDEVLAVGDDEFQRRCLEKIDEMRRTGRTIVVVSHSLDTVQSMCERVAWIDRGVLRALGEAHDVVSRYQASYFAAPEERVELGSDEHPSVTTSVTSPAHAFPTTGAKCELTFTVRALEALELEVRFRIRRTDGVLVGGADSPAIPSTDGSAPRQVRFEIERLALNPGEYDVEVQLVTSNNQHVHYQDPRNCRFSVAATGFVTPYGAVDLLGTWGSYP